jgi:hypothetical protein
MAEFCHQFSCFTALNHAIIVFERQYRRIMSYKFSIVPQIINGKHKISIYDLLESAAEDG